jgi:hypothetical protein
LNYHHLHQKRTTITGAQRLPPYQLLVKVCKLLSLPLESQLLLLLPLVQLLVESSKFSI